MFASLDVNHSLLFAALNLLFFYTVKWNPGHSKMSYTLARVILHLLKLLSITFSCFNEIFCSFKQLRAVISILNSHAIFTLVCVRRESGYIPDRLSTHAWGWGGLIHSKFFTFQLLFVRKIRNFVFQISSPKICQFSYCKPAKKGSIFPINMQRK